MTGACHRPHARSVAYSAEKSESSHARASGGPMPPNVVKTMGRKARPMGRGGGGDAGEEKTGEDKGGEGRLEGGGDGCCNGGGGAEGSGFGVGGGGELRRGMAR